LVILDRWTSTHSFFPSLALSLLNRLCCSCWDQTLSEKVEASKSRVFTIKEGVDYRLKVFFRVQNEIVTGLKYIHVVKRMGVKGILLVLLFSLFSFLFSFSFFFFSPFECELI